MDRCAKHTHTHTHTHTHLVCKQFIAEEGEDIDLLVGIQRQERLVLDALRHDKGGVVGQNGQVGRVRVDKGTQGCLLLILHG